MKQLILDFHRRFETFIVCLLLLLLMLTVLIATLEFFYLFWTLVGDRVREMDSVELFRSGMHRVFAGFLVLLLGIELMETVRMYLTEHVIHVEIVFLVAMIAFGLAHARRAGRSADRRAYVSDEVSSFPSASSGWSA